MTVVTDYTGILYSVDEEPNWIWNAVSGSGTPIIVTYSFAEGADLAYWEGIEEQATDGFSSFTATQRGNFRLALAVYEHAMGVVFVESTGDQAMISVMNSTGSDWSGWANTANSDMTSTSHGRLVMDIEGNYEPGSDGFFVLLHELGHAMGLEHPWEGGLTLDPAIDDQAHTVMTYNSSSPYTLTLGTLDVDALQYQYGLPGAVAGWDVAMVAGVLFVAGSTRNDVMLGALGPCEIIGRRGNDKVYGKHDGDTLHGNGGDDTLSGNAGGDQIFGGAGRDVLHGFGREVLWVEGNDSLYGGDGGDVLRGGYGHDLVSGGSGDDRLFGAAGDDSLFGGGGDDLMFGDGTGHSVDHFSGGSGSDRFVLTAADGGSDVYLTDFTRGEDKIDLRDFGIGFADVVKSGAWLRVGTLWINTTVTAAITEGDFVF